MGALALATKQDTPISRAPKDIRPELLAAMREIIRYAVMTLNALQDPDRKYLGWAQLPMHVVHDTRQAYGYSSAWVRSFQPTAHDISQMEVVAGWLAWLRRMEGEIALRRIIAWSLGVAHWRQGQREQCSDRTIQNRIDRSVSAIIKQFTGTDIPVERVEEPYKGAIYAIIFDPPDQTSEGVVKPMKIYIGGQGMWKDGKWLNDGTYRLRKIRGT